MTEAFEKFLEVSQLYLKDCRTSAAQSSFINRRRTLSSYISALDESGTDPGVLGILTWKQALADRGLKKSTIRQYLVELHAFYEWAIDHRFYKENPVKKSDMPKDVKKPYQLMSEDQMLRLLQRVEPHDYRKDRIYWIRNRAIVITLITTSIRNHELINLTVSDLDWENSEILIRSGKGDKDRWVNFPDITKAAIREYWSCPEMPKDPPPDFPVFAAFSKKTGEPGPIRDAKSLSTYVKRYVARVIPEYGKDVRSHALRHVGASLLLTNGDAMEQIQQILGHANASTTKVYAARLRPDKTHVKNANRIWEEIEYQTGLSQKASEEAQRRRMSADGSEDPAQQNKKTDFPPTQDPPLNGPQADFPSSPSADPPPPPETAQEGRTGQTEAKQPVPAESAGRKYPPAIPGGAAFRFDGRRSLFGDPML